MSSRRDAVSGGVLLAVGVTYTVAAWRLQFGVSQVAGAGDLGGIGDPGGLGGAGGIGGIGGVGGLGDLGGPATAIGPGTFPLILGTVLVACAVALLWRVRTTDRAGPADDVAAEPGRERTVMAVIAATLAYVAAFTTLGFLLATWLYTLAVSLAFRAGDDGGGQWRGPDVPGVLSVLLASALTTIVVYLVLDAGLGARLPAGSLFTGR